MAKNFFGPDFSVKQWELGVWKDALEHLTQAVSGARSAGIDQETFLDRASAAYDMAVVASDAEYELWRDEQQRAYEEAQQIRVFDPEDTQ